MGSNNLVQYLEQHPRMMGVLFTTCLLLTQAAPVIAGDGCDCPGT